MDAGAPSVAPSAHANRVGASGEVDVVDNGTHAAGCVSASHWLLATLGATVVMSNGENKRTIGRPKVN